MKLLTGHLVSTVVISAFTVILWGKNKSKPPVSMRAEEKLTPADAQWKLIGAADTFKTNQETLLTIDFHHCDLGWKELSVIEREMISFLDGVLQDTIAKAIHNTQQTHPVGRVHGNVAISAHIKFIFKEEHLRAESLSYHPTSSKLRKSSWVWITQLSAKTSGWSWAEQPPLQGSDKDLLHSEHL